jgi:hypothetical protein
LNDKPSLQELLEVQEHFGLPGPALVAKIWFIVKALAAIAAVDIAPFRPVFIGGTALRRAHGVFQSGFRAPDPRRKTRTKSARPASTPSGGRLQIGTLAGFKLECMAGFVGSRK